MFFLLVFSFAVGYLLNEECSIMRIGKKSGLLPLGWFVLKERSSLWLFSVACITAFLKGYVWALCLMKLGTDYEFIFGGSYVAGNITAAQRTQGLLFTPILAALGITLAMNEPVFQITITALAVAWLVTRRILRAALIARVSFCVAFFIYSDLIEFSFWTALVLIASTICNRESPFRTLLIKYSGRMLRWRVTI